MTEKKSDTSKKQDATKEKANAPAADPGRQPDADALKQASGQDKLGESGNQDDWRDRPEYQEGDK